MTRARTSRPRCRNGRGMYLLEALVALIVFSLGMLGLLGLLAGALRASGSAKWRNEGFDIAATAVAHIATDDPASVVDRYSAEADGSGYRALLAQAMRLPGVTADANAPSVAIDDAIDSRRIRVTVQWQLPGESAAHQASIHAVLPHR